MLRGTILTMLAAAAALAPPAAAAGPPEGRPCSFLVTDGGSETWTGYLAGGPVTAAGAAVSLRCTIHVGNAAHTGPSVAEASAGPAPGVVAVATLVSYAADPGATHAVCTEATVAGTAWYWDGDAWTTDPGAGCPVPVTTQPEDLLICLEACEPFSWDETVCAVTGRLTGTVVPGVVEVEEDGDVHVAAEPFWDCPPYDEYGTRQK
ncbi:MAG TPA: hypothetical protein VNQ77_03585 [Frankiaceae bacterium]|nr:hypothetical protein [Frankiaceae bacterium]